MSERATLGLMGKHPGYGDFLKTGISDDIAEALTAWLDPVLMSLRDEMADNWAPFWDGAQDLRFWVGRAVLGRTLVGVLRPWRDRVGRRYPLLLIAESAAVLPPVLAPKDQAPWEALHAHLHAMTPGQGAKALLDGLKAPIPREDEVTAGTGPTVWAHHPEGDLAQLLESAAPVDADRAQLARSYWWATGGAGRSSVWMGTPGLPQAPALGWLLAGVPSAAPEEESAPDDEQ
ncbi:MAG: type VI secretion system-associated protein TagF [Maritimibacter sp.]